MSADFDGDGLSDVAALGAAGFASGTYEIDVYLASHDRSGLLTAPSRTALPSSAGALAAASSQS